MDDERIQAFQILVEVEDGYLTARLAPPPGQFDPNPHMLLASVHRAAAMHQEVADAFESMLRLVATALVADVGGKELADSAEQIRVENP